MKYIKFILMMFVCFQLSCQEKKADKNINQINDNEKVPHETKNKIDSIRTLFIKKPSYKTDGFDFPVGKPDAKGYYNAQGFGENNHLGDDWNAVTGGNSDLGDPIYAIANGYVNFAKDIEGGWGNVIRIWHQIDDKVIVESLYAHCDKILVKKGQYIKKGHKIGTIGNAGGIYLAHLHFEIRNNTCLPIGGGYSELTDGYINPTKFIKENREKKD